MSEQLPLERPDHGVLFVVSGPSGVGKSTLVREAMKRIPRLEFSVSATTRSPRRGEHDGVHYLFLSPERFADLVRLEAFLEHATVYDRAYGTLRAPVEAALAEGRSIVLDVDVQGSRQVRSAFPDAVHVFVLPPDVDTLERRLRRRGTDDEDTIRRRMGQIEEQVSGAEAYDYLVLNDDLDVAHAAFQGIVIAELSRRSRRDTWIERARAQIASRGP